MSIKSPVPLKLAISLVNFLAKKICDQKKATPHSCLFSETYRLMCDFKRRIKMPTKFEGTHFFCWSNDFCAPIQKIRKITPQDRSDLKFGTSFQGKFHESPPISITLPEFQLYFLNVNYEPLLSESIYFIQDIEV